MTAAGGRQQTQSTATAARPRRRRLSLPSRRRPGPFCRWRRVTARGNPERPPRSRARPRQGRPGRAAGPLVYLAQLSAPPARPRSARPPRRTRPGPARHGAARHGRRSAGRRRMPSPPPAPPAPPRHRRCRPRARPRVRPGWLRREAGARTRRRPPGAAGVRGQRPDGARERSRLVPAGIPRGALPERRARSRGVRLERTRKHRGIIEAGRVRPPEEPSSRVCFQERPFQPGERLRRPGCAPSPTLQPPVHATAFQEQCQRQRQSRKQWPRTDLDAPSCRGLCRRPIGAALISPDRGGSHRHTPIASRSSGNRTGSSHLGNCDAQNSPENLAQGRFLH